MRHCFFIFDYDDDLARARHIESLDLAVATAAAGFDDDADWKAAVAKGGDAVKALIDNAILATSATVVLIGERTAEEFGDACAYLCSAQASYITGQNLLLDGGSYPGTF